MDRVVIITGSTRGIGFRTAAEFLRSGDRVAVFCRHEGHSKEAEDRLSKIGRPGDILSLAGDVRKASDVKRIVSQCLKRFGRIDVLVNNAGIAANKPIEKTMEKTWEDVLNTNLKGPFLFIQQVFPIMKKQGEGIVINVSSGLGVEGIADFSAYCASKFGLIGLTQVAADEAASSGIKVYAVLPGAVDTGLIPAVGLAMDPSELLAPEYVAKKILKVAEGKLKSGQSIEIYE